MLQIRIGLNQTFQLRDDSLAGSRAEQGFSEPFLVFGYDSGNRRFAVAIGVEILDPIFYKLDTGLDHSVDDFAVSFFDMFLFVEAAL